MVLGRSADCTPGTNAIDARLSDPFEASCQIALGLFELRALDADLKMNELFSEALTAWEEKHGIKPKR